MSTQGIITSQSVDMDQIGAAISSRLTDSLDHLPHDITERLRAARMRAVANRQISVVKVEQAAQSLSISGGVASLQGDDDGFNSWWNRIGAILPLLALVAGLITIAVIQDENRIQEVAEVDAELLTDELPPSAYVDPGFAQFVRSNRAN